MKKFRFWISTLSSLSLPFIALSCNKVENKQIRQNRKLIEAINEYQKDFKHFSKLIFKNINQDIEDEKQQENQKFVDKNILLNIVDNFQRYGFNKNTQSFNIFEELKNKIIKLSSDKEIIKFNSGSDFYNGLKAINSLTLDLISQYAASCNNLKHWNKSIWDNLLTNIKSNKVIEKNRLQELLTNEYRNITNTFANLDTKKLWEDDQAANLIIYDEKNTKTHAHSHAVGNMLYELYKKLFYLQQNKYDNEFKKSNFLKYYNNLNSHSQELLKEFKNKFNSLLSANLDKLKDFALSYKNASLKLITKLKNIATLMKFNEQEKDSIFPKIKLANGNNPK